MRKSENFSHAHVDKSEHLLLDLSVATFNVGERVQSEDDWMPRAIGLLLL